MVPRKKNKNNIWHVYSNIYLPRIIHVTLLSKFLKTWLSVKKHSKCFHWFTVQQLHGKI